jgi:hypothetical protein
MRMYPGHLIFNWLFLLSGEFYNTRILRECKVICVSDKYDFINLSEGIKDFKFKYEFELWNRSTQQWNHTITPQNLMIWPTAWKQCLQRYNWESHFFILKKSTLQFQLDFGNIGWQSSDKPNTWAFPFNTP